MKKRIFTTLLLVLFASLLLAVLLTIRKYIVWEESFEQSRNEANLVLAPYKLDEETEKKIAQFTLSNENTEFLVLSPAEFANIVLLTSESFLEEGYSVEEVYIDSGLQVWNIYIEVTYKSISVWLSADLRKDNMQTAQLYITDVCVGPYSIGKYFNLVERINAGIANAVLTVNENGFSGRYIENIELVEDQVVVKGSRY